MTSEEVSTIDDAFLATERAELTAEEYAQEYLAKFQTPGLGLVDPDRLEELTVKEGEDQSPWARAKKQ